MWVDYKNFISIHWDIYIITSQKWRRYFAIYLVFINTYLVLSKSCNFLLSTFNEKNKTLNCLQFVFFFSYIYQKIINQ